MIMTQKSAILCCAMLCYSTLHYTRRTVNLNTINSHPQSESFNSRNLHATNLETIIAHLTSPQEGINRSDTSRFKIPTQINIHRNIYKWQSKPTWHRMSISSVDMTIKPKLRIQSFMVLHQWLPAIYEYSVFVRTWLSSGLLRLVIC
jgi:hypothetical protein